MIPYWRLIRKCPIERKAFILTKRDKRGKITFVKRGGDACATAFNERTAQLERQKGSLAADIETC
jgi:hypothetical protein